MHLLRFAALALFAGLAAAAAGMLDWEDTAGGPGTDLAQAVAFAGPTVVVGGQTAIPDADSLRRFWLRAYDRETGSLAWEDLHPQAGSFAFVAAIASQGRRVFAVGTAGDGLAGLAVRAHDAETGELLWEDLHQVPFGRNVGYDVALEGDRVFATGVVQQSVLQLLLVRAYHAGTGELLWSAARWLNDVGRSAIAARDGRVFAATGDVRDFLIAAWDGESGALLWEQRGDPGGGLTEVSDLAAVGRVLVVSGYRINADRARDVDWVVRAFDAETGAFLWEDLLVSAPGDDGLARTVTGKGSRVFAVGTLSWNPFRTADHEWAVRALDAETGAGLWEDTPVLPGHAFDATLVGSQLAVAGVIRDAGDVPRFAIRAYDARTGALLWEELTGQGTGRAVAGDRRQVVAAGDVTTEGAGRQLHVRALQTR